MSGDRTMGGQQRPQRTRHSFMGSGGFTSAGGQGQGVTDFRGSETTLDDIKSQWQKAKDEFDQKSVTSHGGPRKNSHHSVGQLKLPANIEHLRMFSYGNNCVDDSLNSSSRDKKQTDSSGEQRGNKEKDRDPLLPLTPRTKERVSMLSKEKDQSIKRSLTQYDDWRKSIREHVEQSISKKVVQRLDTPPEERLKRSKLQQQKKNMQEKDACDDVTNQCGSPSSRADSVDKRPGEEWQKRFGSAARSHFEARPASRLHDTIRETTAAINEKISNSKDQIIDSSLRTQFVTSGGTSQNPLGGPDGNSTPGEISQYEQRVKLFAKFNKEGYREALRKGELVDGPKIGQYIDSNGIVLTSHGPFWPVGFGPIVSTPHHIVSSESNHAVEPLWTDETNSVSSEKVSKRVVQYYNNNNNTSNSNNNSSGGSNNWNCGPLLIYDSTSIEAGQLVPPDQQLPKHCPPHLEFESRFESGNLHQVYRVGLFDYELVLKSDIFTERHTQWFYFRMRNMIPHATYTFRIINFTKPDSLYNYGMRLLFYSEVLAKSKDRGWYRTGHHIDYSQPSSNDVIKSLPEVVRNKNFFVLSWQVEFPHASDTCYFAHCFPYPFSRIRDYVEKLTEQTHKQRMFRREILCETRARNTCYLLTITSNLVPDHQKKAIIVTCRVHPGETNSSWVLEGFLDFITSQHQKAQSLRNQYIFKIIPCLNPDGVIVGNYRCSLFGRDMNRNYRRPKREFFPTIWHVKNVIERTLQRNEVLMYVDLHGHSRRHNVFMYGCDASYLDGEAEIPENYLNERLFPFLMSMKGPDLFSFSKSKFHIKKCKESTGRAVIFRDYKVFNSFTMETSLSGTTAGATATQPGKHFGMQDLKRIGLVFGESLFEYSKIISDQMAQHDYILELTRVIAHQMIDQSCLAKQEDDVTEDVRQGLLNEADIKAKKEEHLAFLKAAKAEKDKAVAEVASLLTKTKNLKDCLKLLEKIKRADMSVLSDTDDSDSTSESEFLDPKSAKTKKKLRSRRKFILQEQRKIPVPESTMSSGKQELVSPSKKNLASMSMYQSPYQGRSGGGYPIFTEERILDRKFKKPAKRVAVGPYSRNTLMQNGYASMIIPTAATTDNEDLSESVRDPLHIVHPGTNSPQDSMGKGQHLCTSYREDQYQPSSYVEKEHFLVTSPEIPVTELETVKSKLRQNKLISKHSRATSATPTCTKDSSSSASVNKRSMTPVKNLFMDTFGVDRQQQLHWGEIGSNKSRPSRAPSSTLVYGNCGVGAPKSTISTPPISHNTHNSSNNRSLHSNGGESLALKALFSGGQAVDRTSGTIISYYIKKK